MELTKEQRNFFADLDLDKALAAGEEKVHFQFPHKDHVVYVEAYSMSCADIIVRRKTKAGVVSDPDGYLSMFDISGTTNVSGPEVLRMVHEEAGKSGYSPLKKAWLATPYVERWDVSVRWSCTAFSTDIGEAQYLIEVTESPDDDRVTVAELSLSGDSIYTFTIPQPYHSDQTVQSLLNLAEAITLAWRDAVLDETYGEESK